METTPTLTEADILAEIVGTDGPGLGRETARIILGLRFSKEATRRIRRLLNKNSRGTITAAERLTLEKYIRVGQFLDLLQAKARLSFPDSSAR